MAEDECGAGRDEHLSIVPATTGRLLVGIDSKLAGAAKFNVLALQPVCGDGTLDHSESCDDKNTDSGDGCDRTCRTELSAKSLVEQEPNDDTIGANVIVLGAATGALTVTGTLGGRCDYDTYAVTVPAKGSVNATLLDGTNACGGGAPSLRVALIAQDGQSLLGEVTSAAGGACPGFGAMQAFSQWLAAGTYSVRVTTAPNDAPTFGYKLRIEVGG
ncbi:MAG: DUF4215 domain-containing protein [Myxococcales bacterium]|nr:DUF4215 domain-containing protein [Myxococcales bacterium]